MRCLIAGWHRFDDRVTGNLASFAPHAKIIYTSTSTPETISKTVDVDVIVGGDAQVSLELMIPHMEFRDRREWFTQINAWKKRYPFKYFDDSKVAKPQYVIEELHRQTNGEAIITTGVGQHQMWAAQFYRWRYARQMITSGGLGTMGYGLPSAMGASLGAPGKIVIDIDGDASFLMTMFELPTIAEYNIPVKVAILNNDFQGMVKQWQDLFYSRRYAYAKMKNPNFSASESHGTPWNSLRPQGRRPQNHRSHALPRRPDHRRFRRRTQQDTYMVPKRKGISTRWRTQNPGVGHPCIGSRRGRDP